MTTHKERVFGNSNFTRHRVNNFAASIGGKTNLHIALYISSFILLVFAILFLSPPFCDDSSSATTGTAVASDTTLSISIANSTLSLDLTPTSANGTFATTTSPATINVATNNITGYTVGIRTSTNSDTSTLLVNTIDQCEDTPTSTKCSLSSLDTAVSVEDYSASTATNLNNTWGYLPSKYNSIQNEDYLPAPTSTGDTINTTTGPNAIDTNTSELTTDEYTINLAARLDYTPYAGSYTNTFIVTAVGNPVPYSVSYDSNLPAPVLSTPEAQVQGMPSAQAGQVSSGDTVAVILSPKVPVLTNSTTGNHLGYGFAGWCTEPTIIINDGTGKDYQKCPETAILYQPSDNFGIDQTEHNTQILYAVWEKPAVVTFNSNTFDNNNFYFTDPATGNLTITNTAEYIPTYIGNDSTCIRTNILYEGTYLIPEKTTADKNNYVMKGWSESQNATEAIYKNEQDIINNLSLKAGDSIELYAVWNYATIITFDKNGADGTETMEPQTIEASTAAILEQNAYTNTDFYFGTWNTEPDGSGITYANSANYTAFPYSNNTTLYAQWVECPPNSICYNDNGANSPTTMGIQSIEPNTPITLWASNYSYANHGFAGWSKDKNAATNILDNDPNNDVIIYGPNQTIDSEDLSLEGLTLYATWISPASDKEGNILSFQTENLLKIELTDTEQDTLSTKPIGYVTALKDDRDNEVYAIAKLKDSRYWMTENLRFETRAFCYNTSNAVQQMNGTDGNIYSYGCYYSYEWLGNPIQTYHCPTNWKAPSGGQNGGSFSTLNNNLNNDASAWRSFPNNFILSGQNSTIGINKGIYRGVNGSYWSSTDYGSEQAYFMQIDSTSIIPGTGLTKNYYARSLRCVR